MGAQEDIPPLPAGETGWITSRMVRLSTLVATRKLIRAGKLALMMPVITSTLGLWVARNGGHPDGVGHLRECVTFS